MDSSKYYLDQFKQYISQQTSSSNTIKNYLSDLRVFFNFADQQLSLPVSSQTLPKLLTETSLVKYDEYLSSTNPPATAKRRTSSLKKFIEFCASHNILSESIPSPSPLTTSAALPHIDSPSPISPQPTNITQPIGPIETRDVSSYTPVSTPPFHPHPPPPSDKHFSEISPPTDFTSPPSATQSKASAGPTPWSAILMPTAPPQEKQITPPPESVPSYSSPPAPAANHVPPSALENFLSDTPSAKTIPDTITQSPSASKTSHQSKQISLYLVLSLILIAFLTSFTLTYLISTSLLSK